MYISVITSHTSLLHPVLARPEQSRHHQQEGLVQLDGQLMEAGGEDLLFWPVSEYQLFELLDPRTLTHLLRQIFIVIQALHSGPAGEEVPAICGQAHTGKNILYLDRSELTCLS